MRSIITLFLGALTLALSAQTTATFESFGLMEGEFLNGSELMPGEAGYSDGNIFLGNNYNEAYMAWSGWAISATTDTETPGFTNDLSAITGEGYDGSNTYAVSYVFGGSSIVLEDAAAGGVVSGFYITNSTYAYLSMLEGDNVAKKFGGETGDDPDYFLLTVKKYYNGTLSTDSVNFYLADYRFEDNSQDYLVDEWAFVDLSSLGNADSLTFNLTSTDVGNFGMNTPAYFCIDNLTTLDAMSNVNDYNKTLQFRVFPNPVRDMLYVENPVAVECRWELLSAQGQSVKSGAFSGAQEAIEVSSLQAGMYTLRVITEEGWSVRPFVKQ